MKNRLIRCTAVAALVMGAAISLTPAMARDQISIVGSSTVFPFSTTVADKFGKKTKFKTPKVISTGSGGGMKLFCKGNGIDTPDITNASRRMKKKEWQKCQANGVKKITEVVIGYDGIVLANAKAAPTHDAISIGVGVISCTGNTMTFLNTTTSENKRGQTKGVRALF